MIRCTNKGCEATTTKQANEAAKPRNKWRWTWMFGWRCPKHVAPKGVAL